MLSVHRALQGVYPFSGNGNQYTALIHKEWPETIARPDKNDRRGNFDLAILNPVDIRKHTVTDFTNGHISPAFVVELGLNYGLDHLTNDYTKLINSNCNQGYLVHLWQPHKGIRSNDIKSLQAWCKGKNNVAIAVFIKNSVLVKHLKEESILINI